MIMDTDTVRDALTARGLTAASGEVAGFNTCMRRMSPGVLVWYEIPDARGRDFSGWAGSAERDMEDLYADALSRAGFTVKRYPDGFGLTVSGKEASR